MSTTKSPQQAPTSPSEATCVIMSVVGDSWDKKPEGWVEEMRIVDAEAKKPEGAENASVEQLSYLPLLTGRLPTVFTNGENCLDVESCRKVARVLRRSNGTVDEAGMDDSPLLALEDRIRSINLHAPIVWTNFCKVDSKALLNMSLFSGESVGKEPDFLQSDGTDHVYDSIVSSVSWSFPGLELSVNEFQARIGSLRQEYSTKLFRYQESLGSEGLQGEVRLSRRPHVTFWWFCVRRHKRFRHRT